MTKNDHFNRKAAARARLQDEFPAVPESFHRRMAETLDGLEEKPVKRKMHWSAMLVAAVILTLATGAIAATYRTGWVDIDGNFTPDENVYPESTHYEPEIEADAPMQMDPVEGEYLEIVEDDGSYGVMSGHTVETMDELATLLNGSDLPVIVVPENLTAEGLSVTTGKEAEPYDTTTLDNGDIVKKYRLLAPGPDTITAYSLSLWDETNSPYLYADVALDVDVPNMRFSASEQDLVETLDVPGYDKALYLRWDSPESVYPEHGPQNQLFLVRAVEGGYLTISVYGQGTELTKDVLLSVAPTIE